MDLLTHNRRMAQNSLWSNDRIYRAVLALKPGEFEATRTSFFPSIKETLNHILAVDHLYLGFVEESGLGASAHDDFVPFDDPALLAEAQADFDRRLVGFCDGLTAAALERSVVTDRREDGMIPGAHRRSPGASVHPPDPPSWPGACDAVGNFGQAAATGRVLSRL